MMRISNSLCAALAAGFLATPLSACNDPSASSSQHSGLVRTEVVQIRYGQNSVTATGSVQARFRADLSFRVSGRVIERLVDVGDHVETGKVLARLDPTEQQADVDAGMAAVAASEAQLRVARTNFDRQKALISQGFTTATAFDQAQEALRSAEASLETAQAQFGTAKDALGYTELRADAAGVITARSLEVGQVVQAAQPVLALARDGDRDAVFDISESVFSGDLQSDQILLRLVSNPNVTATGHVREVSPVLDPKTSTVRVKVAIENPPAEMALGSAVVGTAKSKPVAQIAVPWTALTAKGSQPAVWLVDSSSNTVFLQPVTIAAYQAGSVVISAGLVPRDRVVVDGGKLLSVGQAVAYEGDRS
jgi:membrane fusion protein, multidrug efflux system